MLKNLADSKLRAATMLWAKREQRAAQELLVHINEVHRRRLFSKWKYESLHKYLTRELGQSDSEAYRKIKASEAIRVLPEIRKELAKGTVTITNISGISGLLTGKGNPLTKEASKKFKSLSKKRELLNSIKGKTQKETQLIVDKIKGSTPGDKTKSKDLQNEGLRVSVTLSPTANADLKFIQNVYATKNIADPRDAIELALRLTAKAWLAKNQRIGSRQGKEIKRQRTISASVQKSVMMRSNNSCENCGSRKYLEFDHLLPVAKGGLSTEENVRHLCRNCNARAAIEHFGQKKLDPHLN